MIRQPHKFLKAYGNWALVTGASDGIGRAIAELLAQAQFNLVLVARRESVLQALATQLSQQYSIEVRVIAADLTDAQQVDAMMIDTLPLDIGLLIASAGFGTSGAFLDANLAQESQMIDVNMRTVMTMAQHYGKRFIARGHGGIILFSSLVAFQGVPMSAHYAATKSYIQTFAEGLHMELKPYGVDVLASAPGPVASGFAERANMQMGAALTPNVVASETLNALGHKMTVRPGLLSKILELSLSLLPRWGRVRAMQQIMSGMTSHQRHQPVLNE